MKQKSLKVNAVLNLIRTAMSLLFPLITFPYSSRILGPDGIGRVAYASSIVSYFSILSGLGISTYGTREAAKIRDDAIKLNKFVKEVFTINLTSTAAAYVLFFTVINVVPALASYKPLLLITCATIIFSTLGMDWIYSAEEDYAYITVRSIIFQFFGLIMLFIMVRTEKDIMQYAALSVITSCGSNLLNFFHIHKYVSLKSVKGPLEIKKHLKPIFTLFGTVVAVSLYSILDTTMLGIIAGDNEVGIYNASTKISKMVIAMVAAIGAVASPRMSNCIEADRKLYDSLLKDIANFYLMFCLPSAVGLFCLACPIIDILCGTKFSAAVIVMKILTPIVVFIPLGAFITDQIFTPMRKDRYSLIPVAAGAAGNLIANFILIPRYGAAGAASASVLAEIIVVVMKIVLAARVIDHIGALFSNLWQYIIAVILMAVMIFAFNKFIDLEIIIKLILSIVTGAFVYFIVLALFKNNYVTQIAKRIMHR